ncbi:Apple-like protein [Artemisia annua]|uniref:Apple-like protein n=1 Tax=Artemisia annua TaxID=35608 RepID=A0A2U1KWP0_ARTAN|nr:Apple-like protein [Artemisia annua]
MGKHLDIPIYYCSLYHHSFDIFLDLETWEVKAKRWARVLFILIKDEHQSDTLLPLLQSAVENCCGDYVNTSKLNSLCLNSLQIYEECTSGIDFKNILDPVCDKTDLKLPCQTNQISKNRRISLALDGYLQILELDFYHGLDCLQRSIAPKKKLPEVNRNLAKHLLEYEGTIYFGFYYISGQHFHKAIGNLSFCLTRNLFHCFTMQIEKQVFGLKPMNCPGHCLIFVNRVDSYRDPDFCYGLHEGAGWPKRRTENENFIIKIGEFVADVTRCVTDSNLSLGISDCFIKCWSSCSCVRFNSSNHNGTGCVFWHGMNIFSPNPHEDSMMIDVIRNKTKNGLKLIWILIGKVKTCCTVAIFVTLSVLKDKFLTSADLKQELASTNVLTHMICLMSNALCVHGSTVAASPTYSRSCQEKIITYQMKITSHAYERDKNFSKPSFLPRALHYKKQEKHIKKTQQNVIQEDSKP